MAIAGDSPPTRWERIASHPWLARAVLGVSTLLVLGLWYTSRIDDAQRARARFELRAAVLRTELSDRMLDYARVLNGGAGLFAASDHVTRKQWHAYVSTLDLDKTQPGVLGTGFAVMVWKPSSPVIRGRCACTAARSSRR